ncbi:CoB--CoM heterodisulfide reductase iron-sulfur subunit B family protein [Syntrophomonas erecta]
MKLAYYPGCSADGSGIEYGMSMERTAKILGIELVELEDWNCCGATSGHSTNKLLSLALPARNLAIAEKTGLDMLAPCAACYSRHRAAGKVIQEDEATREKIAEIIEMDIEGSIETLSILDVLANQIGADTIKAKVTNPLNGMKAACYYGCLLVRPVELTGFDDPEDPQSMDKIVQALGAETIDWSFKTECCGAAMVTSRPDVGNRMLYNVLRNAREAGAECLVTACPLCMLNLDMRQAAVEREYNTSFNIPTYYVTELLAIACGDSPNTVGIDKHFVEAGSYLETVRSRAAEAKSADAKKAGAGSESSEDAEALQKKIDAMIKGFEKNTEKMAAKLIDDQESAKILAEVVTGDEKKIARLAEFMVTDRDKAVKAAEAFVAAELKKRAK